MKSKNFDEQPSAVCRLDTWLWASRFYKSRKLATEAIKAGHISVNGQKSKPGKRVRISDQLSIKKHQLKYQVEIRSLSEKRLGAPLAQTLYHESEDSRLHRDEQLRVQKELRSGLSFDKYKPNKRARLNMLRVKQQQPD
ncbi:MAG: hypothetical protein GKR95_16945 [Gammaproteobacteria bacterium]|nr:hypothetical protein [Gammaproteobacteria bacterium]